MKIVIIEVFFILKKELQEDLQDYDKNTIHLPRHGINQ